MKYLLLLFLIIPSLAFSQFLINKEGHAFTQFPFFNHTFVKALKIAELKGSISLKKKFDVIQTTADWLNYHFDTLGHLIQIEEVKKVGEKYDTSSTFFSYDEFHQLTQIKYKVADHWITTQFSFDSSGKINQEIQYQEAISGKIKPILLKWETIKSVPLENGILKKFYNENNVEVKEQTILFLKNGEETEETERWTLGFEQVKKKQFFTNNRLVEHSIFINDDSLAKVQEVFSYDNEGELISKNLMRNGENIQEWQIIYDAKNKVLSAVLILDEKTGTLKILRYSVIKHEH